MLSRKWMNAREALRGAIRPGDRIFFSIAAAQPQTLLQALAEDFESYQNVEIINGYLLAGHPLAKEGLQSSFHCMSLQNSPALKKDWEEGRIDFLPVRYSDIPRIFSPGGSSPVNVALIQVAPADREGRFSLGASTSLAYPIAKEARTIVAEVNDRAPRTFGPCFFQADEIDFFVECSIPLIPYPEIRITEADRRIARFVAELNKYIRPELLVIDELGYLPIDKRGADLLFQIISGRYECGSIVLTTNKAFKHWPTIFNNDSTLTSALLDRILHHAETVVIEGKSYRMKDRIEP